MLVTTKPAGDSRTAIAEAAATKPLVHVVEDEPSILALFRNMGRLSGFDVATYDTMKAFLDEFDTARTGCIVLDLNLPDGTGIEILEQLAARNCCMPVVFMSGMARVSEAVAALKLGSLDFVEKPFDLNNMLASVRRAIATDVERRSESARVNAISSRFSRLTPRETEVMEFVVRGSPNKEIAARL
ncbi:MAG: response regulator transcription factor, partial [Planctomycetes bacterium]|nr:response regulator transcription factor [Planctomycetota bacterium]